MSELDDMRQRLEALEGKVARLDALEAEVIQLRDVTASTSTLASMADRDVAEMRISLRAHTQVLNALRETQLEQGTAIDAIAEKVGTHDRTLREIAEVVGSLAVGQQHLAEQQETLTLSVRSLADGQAAILNQLHRMARPSE